MFLLRSPQTGVTLRRGCARIRKWPYTKAEVLLRTHRTVANSHLGQRHVACSRGYWLLHHEKYVDQRNPLVPVLGGGASCLKPAVRKLLERWALETAFKVPLNGCCHHRSINDDLNVMDQRFFRALICCDAETDAFNPGASNINAVGIN